MAGVTVKEKREHIKIETPRVKEISALAAAWQDHVLAARTVRKWVTMFFEGRECINGYKQPDRPRTWTDETNI